jgi:hypothetical protein
MRTEIPRKEPRKRIPASARRSLAARSVEPELLDQLRPTDQRAEESRRDLKRVNWWMGNARILAAAVRELRPSRIVEIGAGDGTLFLRVAREVAPAWMGAEAVLLDRHPVVDGETQQELSGVGCRPSVQTADALRWLESAPSESCHLMLANLFLHHFTDADLTVLLCHAARVTRHFVAVEPRRSRWALNVCRLLGLIGCNDVTRHDAAVSVRAGFRAAEISRSWPAGAWDLREEYAGPFSHLFVASRKP